MAEGADDIRFLHTGSAARSRPAQAIPNCHADGRLHGFSAGSVPKGELDSVFTGRGNG